MKVIIEKQITLNLVLNEDEIIWLRDQTQNYMGTEDNLETDVESKIRKEFFQVTMKALGYNPQPDGSLLRSNQ